MKLKTLTLALLVGVMLSTIAAAHPPAAGPGDDELYRRGSAAIDSKTWGEAITAFREMASRGGAKGDRAWYWLAYAQQKSGRAADALASLGQLEQKYPDSKWKDDAAALALEAKRSLGRDVAPESLADDELKLLAITSLLHSDQERAITLLQGILSSPKNSNDVKEHAIFVLTQSSSPRARPLLESAARGGMGAGLQESALQLLGTSGDPRNRALLLDVLQKSTDPKVKEAALEGLMISGDKASLLSVAKSDADPKMRSEAVELLGVLKATAELEGLWKSEKHAEVRESIIEGMFVAGNSDWILNLAKHEPDMKLRVEAIELLGAMGASSEILMQLWRSESSPKVKEAVIDAFMIKGDATSLIALAKSESDRKLRREIVERLAAMTDPEAQSYMLELLED